MTAEALATLKANVAAEPSMDVYWLRPDVVCQCGRTFSDAVAGLHAERTGHAMGPAGTRREAA